MFRNILHSRRVNKARRRLMALLPPDWVTVPTFALRTSAEQGVCTYTNNALDLYSENALIELFVAPFQQSGNATDCRCKELDECPTHADIRALQLTSIPNHVSTLAWNPDCCAVENVPNGFSLAQILHILMKTLEPESIFALDSVLRSSVLSGSQLSCLAGERSDCVFVTNMCIWTDHMYGVRMKHNSGCLAPPTDGRTDCSCLLQQLPPKSTELSLEPKVADYCSGSDTRSSEKTSCAGVVLFDPLLAVCKAWRWPDLASGEWIRRLNLCEATQNGAVNRLCINPHHWSRVILTDSTDYPTHRDGSQDNQHQSCCTNSADLRFEDDPDLMRVGLTAIQAVKLCHCRSGSNSFDLSDAVEPGRSKQTVPTVSIATKKPCDIPAFTLSPDGNVAIGLPTLCTARPSPSTFQRNWHSDTSSVYDSPDHSPCGIRHPTSNKSRFVHSFLGGTVPFSRMPQAERIENSSSTSSGEVDCVTGSTELIDSSFDLSRENVSDCCVSVPLQSTVITHHLSRSTSGSEEFSPTGSYPKKPRPLSTNNNCGPRSLRPATATTTKPWAKLSFWEETRHVGQNWFSFTAPLVRVVYDVAEKENHDQCDLNGNSKTRANLQKPFRRVRRRGADVGCVSDSPGAHCIRLSRLVNRHRCNLFASSSVSKMNTSWVTPSQSYHLTACTGCSLDKQTQGPRFSSSSSWSSLPLPHKRSSSWRQCYRLGSQGIAFHLTPTGRVWIDNQTLAANLPLFVSSSFFIRNATSSLSDWPVYRVPAGCSILVFDQLAYQNARPSSRDSVLSDRALPHQHHHTPVVHVSLGKGWGRTYRRPDLTHCPARLELWINVEHLCTVTACSA